MAVTNRIQLGRDASVFVKQESTAGTLVYPAAADFIVPSGSVEFNQQPSYTISTEVRGNRSLRSRFLDMNPAGTWSIPMYVRPSGTAGTVPDGHVLLYSVFGSTTTYAGSSVTYTCSNNDHISMSIYVGMKDMVFALVGCTTNEWKCMFTNKGALNMTFSGNFMTMKWAGKADTSAFSTSTFTLLADDVKQFCVGMKIKIWGDNTNAYFDSGAAYTIASIGPTSVVISETPAYTWASGDWIEGYMPTGTEVGTPIEARASTFSLTTGGSPTIPVISADVTLNNAIKYLEDEISTNMYPTSYIADTRNATAATQLYLRTDVLNFFKDSGLLATADKVQGDLLLTGGSTAGSRIKVAMPIVEGSVPNISGDLEKMIGIDFQALASAAYNDEIKVTFY